MLTENLQIYRDLFELSKRLMVYSKDVSKVIRYGEYSTALSMTLQSMDFVYVANSDRSQRIAAIQNILQLIGGVRSRVRLFVESGYINVKRATALQYYIDRIGKQATGWRNASQSQSYGVAR